MKKAIYAGSFDPFTLGHQDITFQSLRLFDKVIIAVANNSLKKSYFDIKTRVKMIEDRMTELFPEFHSTLLEIISFENEFLVDVAVQNKARFLIRGIRNTNDLPYELQLKNFNTSRNPEIDTVFLSSEPKYNDISSTLVRNMVGINGWEKEIGKYVSNNVVSEFEKKVQGVS